MKLIVKLSGAFFALAFATVASAQMPGLAGPNALPFQPSWSQTFGTNVPSAAAKNFQVNYPYPGQCIADGLNAGAFPGLATCAANTGSWAPVTNGCSSTMGVWMDCAGGAVKPYVPLAPVLPPSIAADPPAAGGFGVATDVKYQHEVLNPPDYTPDTLAYTGADYYEIGLHEAAGFQTLATLLGPTVDGAFPNPAAPSGAVCNGANCSPHPYLGGVPTGMQWTGLRCNNPAGCACRSDFSTTFCPTGVLPYGAPLYTQIWGVGQINKGGTLGVNLALPNTPWSNNNYIATWPSISIRGTRGRPVVVKWVNEFPNNHVFCPHPEAADWPCAIDRTFMGVKATIDPALEPAGFAPAGFIPEGVNKFGSPQQPDNSWVTHLHGGEIPPSTDGFAEKWFGNRVTGPIYSPNPVFVSPPFENPSKIGLKRPAGFSDVYTYPMIQEEALIWFHDHTLGKTHHNVIAGPAGFFPVKDPAKHAAVVNGVCQAGAGQDCSYTWLDPLTEPRGAFGIPSYDMFFAIQDRAFNEDGSINFSNGLGQPVALPPAPYGNTAATPLPCIAGLTCSAAGTTPVTPGANPQVHPTWIPEYFGDQALVNGVLWPKKTVVPGWYRIRMVDGSDSRCWTIGLSTLQPVRGVLPTNNVSFYIIGGDQGYLKKPVATAEFTMCPGERYEILVNFQNLRTVVGGVTVPATSVWMTNKAAAPFPAGVAPQDPLSPFADLDTVMRFDIVNPTAQNGLPQPVRNCVGGTAATPYANFTWPTAGTPCIPNPFWLPNDPSFVAQSAGLRPPPGTTGTALQNWVPAGGIVRMVYLNERLDGQTGAPLGMQLNGVPFEYKVTETPKQNAVEVWKFVNLTVDAHPMHPHLVKHLVVSRQVFNVAGYKQALCGSTTCQPGTSPGNEMQVVPDVTPFLTASVQPVLDNSRDGMFKDAVQAPPAHVTTIAAKWEARWAPVAAAGSNATAPGTAGAVACEPTGTNTCSNSATWTYEPVTSGPFVWHCHINSHEDSEMMRTSLVVP